jgi:hypothetical protein
LEHVDEPKGHPGGGRAIEMVRDMIDGSQPTISGLAGGRVATVGDLGGSLLVHSVSPMLIFAVIEAERDLRECETLLRRAIAMVRSQTRLPTEGIIASKPFRVVEIHHDPAEAAYVAIEAKSGLSVLRHQDSARLRAMCHRIGWQIADDGLASAGR